MRDLTMSFNNNIWGFPKRNPSYFPLNVGYTLAVIRLSLHICRIARSSQDNGIVGKKIKKGL